MPSNINQSNHNISNNNIAISTNIEKNPIGIYETTMMQSNIGGYNNINNSNNSQLKSKKESSQMSSQYSKSQMKNPYPDNPFKSK